MNFAMFAQRIETPDQFSPENLISKVRRLVDCLSPSEDLPASPADLENLKTAKRALDAAKSVDKEISRLQQRIAELEYLAETDELTGLLNRRGFNQVLNRTLSNASRYDERGVLVYIDLDGFKPINDTYGHAAGDEVLRRVGRLLHDNIRDTDYVGRLGGDEFAILLARTSWENGLSRAEVIDKHLNSAVIDWHGRIIAIKGSLGLQTYGARDEGLDLLSRADDAMYRTKRLRCDLKENLSDGRHAAQ